MTSEQKATIEDLRNGQVAFPPMWEKRNGDIVWVGVESFSGDSYAPGYLTLTLATVNSNGEVVESSSHDYLRDD